MNNSINHKEGVNNTPNLIIKGLIGENFPLPNGFLWVHKTTSKYVKIMSILSINVEDSQSTRALIWTKESVTLVKHSLCNNVLWSSKYFDRGNGLRTKIGGVVWV